MNIENIKNRALILKLIREFFTNKNYLEVETPIISKSLIPEPNLSIFNTEFTHPFKSSEKGYLIPSPEVWLKRFLSKNHCNIFEISKCFRNSEQTGKQHNPEFTMIEYYTMDFTHIDTLNLTKGLLDYINSSFPGSKLPKKSIEMTMDEAFIKYAGFSLENNYSLENLKDQASKLDIYISDDDDWEETFNRIFIDKVEPYFPTDVNLFLTNFPSNIKTLAKNIAGTPWAERWELYINGIECGNCYTEEVNPNLVKAYFDDESKLVNHNVDNNYYRLFETFPNCSGGAIGIDRLVMGILGIEEIQGVILFPSHDSI